MLAPFWASCSPELVAQTSEIGRQFRGELKNLSGRRMDDSEYMGMQGLTFKLCHCLGCRRPKQFYLGAEPCPVGRIAEQWVPDMGEVDPDLVGASRREAT